MKRAVMFSILIGALFLLSCSQSGRRVRINANGSGNPIPSLTSTPHKTVVKMEKRDGIYEIPTEINGVSMTFIFDTGAGIIAISEKEIEHLRQEGKFSEADILGTGTFTDANGDVSVGTVIVLKTVKIGDRLLNNVEASIVPGQSAPLLMGQSALENFGKISIDYKKAEIVFE